MSIFSRQRSARARAKELEAETRRVLYLGHMAYGIWRYGGHPCAFFSIFFAHMRKKKAMRPENPILTTVPTSSLGVSARECNAQLTNA
eukprot:scaffold104194_cov32-Tisochrysis_lutea.AAC.2